MFCLLVVLVELSVLAKWLARKTPLRKPNRGEGIVSTKPRPKSECDFLGLLYCFIVLLCICVFSCPYVIYYPTVMAWYSLFVLKVPLNPKQTNKQTNIALAACSVKRRKRAKRFWMRPLFQRRHERGAYNTLIAELRHSYVIITWFHKTLSLAATLLPHEYFPTCWKACNYCSVLHTKIACNNCTWNHGFSNSLHPSVTLSVRCRNWV